MESVVELRSQLNEVKKGRDQLRCPSYRGSTKKSIEMYGPTLGVNFSEVSVIKVDVVDCINICPPKIEPFRTVKVISFKETEFY